MNADDVCFYTISNDKFFLGLVALINSLVLTGHQQPIVVGDCGLTGDQRNALRQYDNIRIISLNIEKVQNPTQYKAFPHIAGAQGIVVIIDSDMIVTGDLSSIIDKARGGKICADANPIDDRWFAEWQDIFGLGAPLRKQTYICAGFVVLSTNHWPHLLSRWWEACEVTHSHPTYQELGHWDNPTAQADQDALNAILMSEYPEEALSVGRPDDQIFRWSFRLVRVIDALKLKCQYGGRSPLILHAALTPKAWEQDGIMNDAYSILMRRLLAGPGLAVRLSPHMISWTCSYGLRNWAKRQKIFFRNMGPAEFFLSHIPGDLGIYAKHAKNVLKQKYPKIHIKRRKAQL